MPGKASARSTSSQRGRRVVGVGDSAAGDPAGTDARFDMDFSGCIALSWPGHTGLEQMLLAADLCGHEVPARAARRDSADGGGPDTAAEGSGPETSGSAAERSSAEPTEAAIEEGDPDAADKSGPETAAPAVKEGGPHAAAEDSGPETSGSAAEESSPDAAEESGRRQPSLSGTTGLSPTSGQRPQTRHRASLSVSWLDVWSRTCCPGLGSPAGDNRGQDPRQDDKWLRLPVGSVPAWPPLPTPDDVENPVSGRRAGRVVMAVPWRTLAGISAEPGSISWLGPITPNAARELAAMAAADPRTEWRVIVTDSAGWTILTTRVPKRGQGRQPDQGSGGSGLVSRITLTLPLDLVIGLAEPTSATAVAPGDGTQRWTSIRVLPRVFGFTRSRSRNSATPSSYERRSSA
jgi:hypothetical protein